jgi:hypothetical protein
LRGEDGKESAGALCKNIIENDDLGEHENMYNKEERLAT